MASLKKLCRVFSLLFSAFTIFYSIYMVVLMKLALPAPPLPLVPLERVTEDVCSLNATRETIVWVGNSHTYLIAAYLDLRGRRAVRILGIANRHQQEVLLCDLCLSGVNTTAILEVKFHADHFGFPYGTTDLLCALPDKRAPEYVSIRRMGDPSPTVLKIQNIDAQDPKIPLRFRYNFLVCISAMFGSYNNVLQFIQSMEMWQMLGAEKVVVYHTDSSRVMKKVLAFYHRLQILDLVPWPINSFLNVSTGWRYPEHLGDLHYYGQTAALNDCLYRNMYRSRYVALNDVDELILPVVHNGWPDLMDSLSRIHPTVGVFIFENHVFPTSQHDKMNPSTPVEWLSVPGLNILEHCYREPNKPQESNPSKMILNPRRVFQTSVHAPLKYSGEKFRVPAKVAKLCHFREPKQKGLQRELLIQDDILSKYQMALVERVSGVLQKAQIGQKWNGPGAVGPGRAGHHEVTHQGEGEVID